MFRIASVCAVVVAIVGDPSRAWAQDAERVALQYDADPRAACPDAGVVASRVDREAGRTVVDAGARRAVRLSIEHHGHELTARISFRDASGGEEASRVLTATHDRCVDLVRGFALLVALHLQGAEAPAPPVVTRAPRSAPASRSATAPSVSAPSVSASAPLASPPAPPVSRTQPDAPAATKEKPPSPSPAPREEDVALNLSANPAPTRGRGTSLLAGPLLRAGHAPGWNPGLRLGLSWAAADRWAVVVETEGTWGGRTQVAPPAAYETSSAGAAVSVCWFPWQAARAGVSVCPDVTTTFVRVSGRGIDVPQSDLVLSVTPGATLRAFVRLVDPWALGVVLGATLNSRPHRIWLDRSEVWTSARWWPTVAVLLSYTSGRGAR
jgi:hypothetical protein